MIVPERRLICSEKAVLLDRLAELVQPGDVVEGRVGSIVSWGAFIECSTGEWRGGWAEIVCARVRVFAGSAGGIARAGHV